MSIHRSSCPCRSVQSSRWQWEGNTHSCTSTSVGFGRGVLDFRCCHWNHAGDSAIAWVASREGGRSGVTRGGPEKKRLVHLQCLNDLQCKINVMCTESFNTWQYTILLSIQITSIICVVRTRKSIRRFMQSAGFATNNMLMRKLSEVQPAKKIFELD